jgi:malate synthase
MSSHATPRTQVHSLHVASNLHQFINSQVLPGTGVSVENFWRGFDAIAARPRRKHRLAGRT